MNVHNSLFPVFVFLTAAVVSASAFALDKIYSPYVEQGEWELEYAGSRTFDSDPALNNDQGHEISLGYGVTDYWKTELGGEFEKEPGESLKMESVEWENVFQLTQPGEYWVDPGLLVSYGHTLHRGDADALEAKLLLAKDTGQFTHVANLGLEQEVGVHSSGGPERSLLWSSRYRYSPSFQPGFELQSDFGKAGRVHGFDEQEHSIGPSIYGRVAGHFKYEAAYLFGVSDAAANGAARLLLEYEMRF